MADSSRLRLVGSAGQAHDRPMQPTPTHMRAGISLTGLEKSFGDVHAVRGIDLDICPGETVAILGPNGAGKSTTIDMRARPVATRSRPGDAVRDEPDGRGRRGRVGGMLQTGSLIGQLTVRELVTLTASLYPEPARRGRGARAHRPGRHRRPAHREAVGGPDPTRPVRHRDRRRSRSARARRADRGTRRRGPPRVLVGDAQLRPRRQDGDLRDALPRGGRRVRRPHRADGPGPDRGRRLVDRDQGAGRHEDDPRHPARTRPWTSSARCPGS